MNRGVKTVVFVETTDTIDGVITPENPIRRVLAFDKCAIQNPPNTPREKGTVTVRDECYYLEIPASLRLKNLKDKASVIAFVLEKGTADHCIQNGSAIHVDERFAKDYPNIEITATHMPVKYTNNQTKATYPVTLVVDKNGHETYYPIGKSAKIKDDKGSDVLGCYAFNTDPTTSPIKSDDQFVSNEKMFTDILKGQTVILEVLKMQMDTTNILLKTTLENQKK